MEGIGKESAAQAELVNWLFLDLNSYFASVEQELRPELRGRPVVVVPVMVDSTCCIAVSYEAKAFGIKTGTGVKEARRMCPSLQVVEGRQALYVEYHHRIVEAVNRCVPVTAIRSIDEMACKLMGRERQLSNAVQIALNAKQAIRKHVGSTLRCSIGLAPNQLLAKVASNMQKPDGLSAITLNQIPSILFSLKPAAIPGIGRSMGLRLERWGISSMEELWALQPAQMRNLWGSIVGERFWHWLRGADFGEMPSLRKSVGHQHVLPPELRSMEQACAVGQKLLHKAAARLRHMQMWAGGLSVYVSFSPRREKRIWEAHTRIMDCQDTVTLSEIFRKLWQECPAGKPALMGVQLYELVPTFLHTPSIFSEESKRTSLASAMDAINAKYGGNTLYLGGIHHVRDAAPTRIAFSSIPEFD